MATPRTPGPRCTKCSPDQKTVRCPRCRRCLAHQYCRCQTCSHCGELQAPKSLCKRCAACVTHHIDSPAENQDFPHRSCNYEPARPTSHKLLGLRRNLGIELEIANLGKLSGEHTRQALEHCTYSWEHDGSVKPSGLELVLDKLKGDSFMAGIAELGARLKSAKCTINESCGFHVHVDAVDFSAFELRRAYLAFSAMQEQIFGTTGTPGLVSLERAYNVYCPKLPLSYPDCVTLAQLSDSGDISSWFYKYLYGIETKAPEYMTDAERRAFNEGIAYRLKDLKQRKYQNTARRQALNFHSWMMRGTLEFRLKEGCVDPEEICWWPIWCGYFIAQLPGLTDKEVLFWFKQPPSLQELTQRWIDKLHAPEALGSWVASKLKGPVKAPSKPLKAPPSVAELVATNWDEALETPTETLRWHPTLDTPYTTAARADRLRHAMLEQLTAQAPLRTR